MIQEIQIALQIASKATNMRGIEEQIEKAPVRVFLRGLLIIAGVWLFYLIVVVVIFVSSDSISIAHYGQLGDTFGAFNALFAACAFVAIAVTLYLQHETLKTQQDELKEQRRELVLTRTEYHLNRLNSEVQSTRQIVERHFDSFYYSNSFDGHSSWENLREALSNFDKGVGSIKISKYDAKGCECEPEFVEHASIKKDDPQVVTAHLKLCLDNDFVGLTRTIKTMAGWIERITASVRKSPVIEEEGLLSHYLAMISLILPPLVIENCSLVINNSNAVLTEVTDVELEDLCIACNRLLSANEGLD